MDQNAKSQFLIAAYQAARAELLERIKMREKVIVGYVAGTITFLGVALGLSLDSSVKIKLACIMPIISLIVSVYVVNQMLMIHALAQYIRTDLSESLKAEGMFANHWDLVSSANNNARRRANWFRVTTHFLAIHLSTAISLIFAIAFFCADDTKSTQDLLSILVAWTVFVVAMWCTWQGIKHRVLRSSAARDDA